MSQHHLPWRHEILVVLTISAVVWVSGHVGLLTGLETVSLDAFLNFAQKADAKRVVVVEIDAEDYRDLFHATSPLSPRVLRDVLAAIARGGPRLVGVDLIVEPAEILAARSREEDEAAVWPPIVWVEDPFGAGSSHDGPKPGVVTGSALFVPDRDHVVRRYARSVDSSGGGHGGHAGRRDTMPWAMIKVNCMLDPPDPLCGDLDLHDDSLSFVMNFAADQFEFRRMTVRDLLAASKGASWGEADGPLRNRIVLLGGVYPSARDHHPTPTGWTAGVYILAQAIESELQHRGIRPLNEALMIALEVIGGLVIVLLHRTLGIRNAFRASVIGIPIIAVISSMIAFFTFSLWGSFASVMVAVLIHELYGSAVQHSRVVQ